MEDQIEDTENPERITLILNVCEQRALRIYELSQRFVWRANHLEQRRGDSESIPFAKVKGCGWFVEIREGEPPRISIEWLLPKTVTEVVTCVETACSKFVDPGYM